MGGVRHAPRKEAEPPYAHIRGESPFVSFMLDGATPREIMLAASRHRSDLRAESALRRLVKDGELLRVRNVAIDTLYADRGRRAVQEIFFSALPEKGKNEFLKKIAKDARLRAVRELAKRRVKAEKRKPVKVRPAEFLFKDSEWEWRGKPPEEAGVRWGVELPEGGTLPFTVIVPRGKWDEFASALLESEKLRAGADRADGASVAWEKAQSASAEAAEKAGVLGGRIAKGVLMSIDGFVYKGRALGKGGAKRHTLIVPDMKRAAGIAMAARPMFKPYRALEKIGVAERYLVHAGNADSSVSAPYLAMQLDVLDRVPNKEYVEIGVRVCFDRGDDCGRVAGRLRAEREKREKAARRAEEAQRTSPASVQSDKKPVSPV